MATTAGPGPWSRRLIARTAGNVLGTSTPRSEKNLLTWAFGLERVTGIEPALSAWEADVLPLNYTRVTVRLPPSGGVFAVPAKTWYRTG
jgi:hypothetical protein